MLWLRTAVFSLAFVALMLVVVPRWILAAAGHPPAIEGLPRVGAAILLVVGVAVMVWCWGAFGVHGRGTPSPFDPPRALVVRGPYCYVRNPMYIGGVLVLVGQAALFASLPLLAYAAAFWLAAHILVRGYEERALARSFGAAYTDYCATVSRWMPHRPRRSNRPNTSRSNDDDG